MFENCSKYATSDELNQFAKKARNLFHLNISLLPYHFKELHNFLTSTDVKFDLIVLLNLN